MYSPAGFPQPRADSGASRGARSADESAAYAPPEIDRSFWYNFGWPTAGCLGGATALMSLLALAGGQSAVPMSVLAPIIVLAGVVFLFLPTYYYSRYRRMQQTFREDAAPGSADRGLVRRRAPTVGWYLDDAHRLTVVVTLLLGAIAALGIGISLLTDPPAAAAVIPWAVYGGLLAVEGLTLALLGQWFFSGRIRAMRLSLYLLLGSLPLAIATLNAGPIIAHLGVLSALGGGMAGLRRSEARITTPQKSDPLEAYYHNLIATLLWVMRADSDVDHRERRKIERVCDAMHLSSYELQVVLDAFGQSPRDGLAAAATNLREAAEALGRQGSLRSVLVTAAVVAAADGAVVDAERDALRQLADTLGISERFVDLVINQEVQRLSEMDTASAREVLGIDAVAGAEEIDSAYQEALAYLEDSEYAHVGETLVREVGLRREAVERAYARLKAEETEEVSDT